MEYKMNNLNCDHFLKKKTIEFQFRDRDKGG